MFEPYLSLWNLAPDGAPLVTHAARLLPVRRAGMPAMLKIATATDEKFGGLLMNWWDGDGAARVLAIQDDAILLERAMGRRSLIDYARNGRDDEATTILCDAVARLHAPRSGPIPELLPLESYFGELPPAAAAHGGLLARSWIEAQALFAKPEPGLPLHGDVHHGNILDFEERGWLAIDPKRLLGEPGFDYANIFTNPDMDHPVPPVATRPEIFARRLRLVVERSGMERRRLLQWIVAWTGLSAAWIIGDGDDPGFDLRVCELALAELAA